MLKLENIVAGYGHITALKDISLEVPQRFDCISYWR